MSPTEPGPTGPGPTDIYSPDLYQAGPPHGLFAELRRTRPVIWQDVPGQEGYWAVLRHADVVAVARQPLLFSASSGGVIIEDPTPRALESMRRMLLAMDPPRHGQFRRPVAPRFRQRAVAAMEHEVRSVCRRILDEACAQGDVEFVQEVAAHVPSRVFGRVMGVPADDLPYLHHLAEQITSSQDPELQDGDGGDPDRVPAVDMAAYAMRFAAERATAEDPPEDLTTLLLSTEFAGSPMDEATFASFFVQLVTAGNDTTKTLLTAGLLTLLEHPDQFAALRGDPGLWPDAVEEMLRFDNPIHYFRRTANADVRLGGEQIRAGAKLAMVYTSANRDEDVFERPQVFDAFRRPNPHLTFGIGEHFCLGAHLARLEARVFFEELAATPATIEPAGPPVRVRSNLNNAFRRAPMRLSPA